MRKYMDEKGRLGGKISVIDLAILLLVILVAVGAYLNFFVLGQTAIGAETHPVRYTVQLQGVRHWAMHNIRPGDAVFHERTEVGTIQRVTAEPNRSLVVGDDGPWWGIVPERYTVFVEVLGTAAVIDGRFMVSRTIPMSAGNSNMGFSTRYASFYGNLTEIAIYGE